MGSDVAADVISGFFGLGMFALLAWGVVAAIKTSDRTRRGLLAGRTRTALDLGLERRGDSLSGELDDVAVRVEDVNVGSTRVTRVSCVARGVADDLCLEAAPRGIFSGVRHGRRVGAPDVDAAVAVRGRGAWQVAALPPEVRAVLVQAVRRGWRFADGAFQRDLSVPTYDVSSEIALGVALAKSLADLERDAAELLVERVETETEPGVRASALRALHEHFPDDARVASLAEPLLASPDLELRLAAAELLDDHTVLSELALGDDEASAAAALRLLTRAPYAPELEPTFVALVQRATAGELPAARVRTLARALGEAPPGAFVPDAVAETLMRALLGEAEPPLRREGIIAALGRIGTVDSVPALAPWRAKLVYGRAARAAIAAIHARAGNPDAGSLQLAEGGGALALAAEPGPSAAVEAEPAEG
ncbi:MAG: hypothetical protein U1F43_20850 [Myxococcota bacterium]